MDAAPKAGVAGAPKTPVDVPPPNRELLVCAPKAGVVLPNGLAPKGLLPWALDPNGFEFAPKELAAGAPNGLALDAPKAGTHKRSTTTVKHDDYWQSTGSLQQHIDSQEGAFTETGRAKDQEVQIIARLATDLEVPLESKIVTAIGKR